MCCVVRNSIFLVEFSLWKFQVNLWISLWAEANTCWLFESISSWKVSSRELKFPENTAKTASLFKMAAKQAMKENLQRTSKYGHLRISQDICHVRMTDIEGFLTIYGHSDNLLNNKYIYTSINNRILRSCCWKPRAHRPCTSQSFHLGTVLSRSKRLDAE